MQGNRVAQAFLRRQDFMRYDVGEVHAIHYAEVCSAYGAARLAAITGNRALFDQVAARHARFLEANIPNTANHVDVNVYGVWPIELFIQTRNEAELARGLAYADEQFAQTRPDGLSTQIRFWIDDLWMIGALQLQAYRATRNPLYFDRTAQTAHAFISRLQQPNGLFHHGENAPFFWGRGNGWVAAGMAEVLSELPPSHALYPEIVQGYQRMMAALLSHQAEDGMWRQLIDYPEAWKESSGTAMFGYAMAVGVKRGVLTDPAYADAYTRAWSALGNYVNDAGDVTDVCVGTGQSQDAAYYLGRPTVTGDLHGQAPLMWFAAALLS